MRQAAEQSIQRRRRQRAGRRCRRGIAAARKRVQQLCPRRLVSRLRVSISSPNCGTKQGLRCRHQVPLLHCQALIISGSAAGGIQVLPATANRQRDTQKLPAAGVGKVNSTAQLLLSCTFAKAL